MKELKKRRMTPKEIKTMSGKHIAISYCGAQFLLGRIDPIGYNAGTFGWNYDIYTIDNVVITTGYRNLVGEHLDYAELETWENKARILAENGASTEDRLALMQEWVSTLC